MYFPYFRGRQYELLALRDLAQKKLITEKTIPIIEPVKRIPGLKNALAAFQASSLPVGLVVNPTVGDLIGHSDYIVDLLSEFGKESVVIPSVLMSNDTEDALRMLERIDYNREDVIAFLDKRDDIERYHSFFEGTPRFTLCTDKRNILRAVRGNRVLFENRFNKKSRNADYPPDEEFSYDHLEYDEDGIFVGFGDYSIIGDEYVESGFAPYAVAIHIVYFAEDKSLRIKHFISDSNDDISDVAGKFYQAVTKLNNWYYGEGQERQLTTGLKALLDHYSNGTYPGLPTLKKLSIMHHLELMDRYLTGR